MLVALIHEKTGVRLDTDIQGIVFDKDGTLFDFDATWSVWCDRMVGDLSNNDPALKSELAALIGYDTVNRSFTSGSLIVSAAANDTALALSDRLPDIDLAEINRLGGRHLQDLPIVPTTDLTELFTLFKSNNLKLGVATNDSEASAHAQLDHFELSGFFDFVCGYDSGFGAKPAAGMIAAFCSATGLQAQQVAMVGDSAHDMNAGHAAGAGLKAGVLTGPATEQELLLCADIVLPDISGLSGLLSLR